MASTTSDGLRQPDGLEGHGRRGVGPPRPAVVLYPERLGTNAKVDQPYESNLSGPTTADSPFSVAELERLLRPYDADAGALPDRITQLAPTLLTNVSRRHEVTTESWSLPCPSVALTPELRTASRRRCDKRARHLVDLLRAKATG